VIGHLQVAWTLESDDPVSGFPGLSTVWTQDGAIGMAAVPPKLGMMPMATSRKLKVAFSE